MERVFARSDSSTIMGTAQASGIALVVAARRGLPIAMHTPSEVKAAVSGNGRADKAQVGAMVVRILRLSELPKPADAADALALAITHVWRGSAQHPPRGRRGPGTSPGQGPEADPDEDPMIAFVRGEVAAVTLNSAVLEVGGVGLELMCTPGTLATLRVGRPATLPTSMVVREDSLTIFGFLDEDEKQVFEIVQTASGVGPKVAQAIVAVMSPDDVRRAITTEDVKALTRVPGHRAEGRPAHHPRAQGPHRPADRRPPPGRGSRLSHRRLARPGAAGPRRARLVGQGVGEGGRVRRSRRRRRPRRRRAAARRPPHAEQGVRRAR